MDASSPNSWIFLEENWPCRWPVEASWPGLFLEIEGQKIDFSSAVFRQKKQKTHLLDGWVERSATAQLPGKKILNIHTKQFAHIGEDGGSALRFSLTPVNFSGKIRITPQLDFLEKCRESAESEPFFVETNRESDFDSAAILLESADGKERMAAAFRFTIYQDGEEIDFTSEPRDGQTGQISRHVEVDIEPLQETVLFRFDTFFNEKKKTRSRIFEQTVINVNRLFVRGFQQLLQEQSAVWSLIWHGSELNKFTPSPAAQPFYLTMWRLFDDWMNGDFFSKKMSEFGHAEASALVFICEKSNLVFLRKTLIDKHLRNSKAMGNVIFGHAVGEYLSRAAFPKNFMEKGLEILIASCRFWFESGEKIPSVLVEKNIEHLSKAIISIKKTDPETWRSLMIRFRFEEKREPRKWLEKLRDGHN